MTRDRVFFENLDGLRFLSFLSVFFYHSYYTEHAAIKAHPVYRSLTLDLFGNGNLGVNFFFVLSGFLITYLLIHERTTRGRIDVKWFWMRRVLRIWPLFYLCVFIGFVVFPWSKELLGGVPDETAHLLPYLVFLNNFDMLRHGLPDASVLGVLWSVAIEEQFYFLWPLLLHVLPVRHYWAAFSLVLGGSLWFRYTHRLPMEHEIHTLSCIGDMAIGGFGAWAVHGSGRFKRWIEELPTAGIALIYTAMLGAFLFRDEVLRSGHILPVVERALIAAVILLVILEQNYARRSFVKLSRFPLLGRLGVISYGLYCLHFVGILITINLTRLTGLNTQLWQVVVLEPVVALGLTIVLAQLSYRFYETPFLRLKQRFSHIRH